MLASELHAEYIRLLSTPTCQQEHELPSRATLRDRITCLAYETGLDRVSEDVIDMMMLALHVRLKVNCCLYLLCMGFPSSAFLLRVIF
jgi:hypothetical protein